MNSVYKDIHARCLGCVIHLCATTKQVAHSRTNTYKNSSFPVPLVGAVHVMLTDVLSVRLVWVTAVCPTGVRGSAVHCMIQN